jgi:class 3 adenylate cyclase/tetratricopeptide (TPR) repeat protein
MSYQPHPIDASIIQLNPSLLELAEHLAKNNHDIWAKARFEEGWKHGPQRDDDKKEHPGLLPYEELSEQERDYDRRTVLSTLQLVLALGYEVREPACAVHSSSKDRVQDIKDIIEKLSTKMLPLSQLRTIWENRDAAVWSFYPEIFILLSERFIGLGEPILGHDVVAEGLKFFGSNLALKKMQALALAQTGATHAARGILQELLLQGIEDADTWGILARTHKDLWRRVADPERKQREIALSFDYYLRGFKKTGDSYPGINAATLSLIMGNRTEAETFAREAQKACLKELEIEKDSYWRLATLAEALLILGDTQGALEQYALAVKLAGNNLAGISSSRRQARLILSYLQQKADILDSAFGMFSVAVFVGHMIDAPNRPSPRFKPEMADEVKAAIRARVDQFDVRIGYSSAASGSDILFLESVLERGGEIHIVLPFEQESFRKISASNVTHKGWGERFDRVVEQAASVTCANPYEHAGSEAVLEYGNQLLLGLATLKAKILDTDVIPIAVWNGLPGDGPGGTASCIDIWRGSGHKVEIVPLGEEEPKKLSGRQMELMELQPHPIPRPFTQKIKAILFADVVGYSRLTEPEIPRYLKHFMGGIAEMMKQSKHRPEIKNTWGDALFMVFKSIHDAGIFSVELQSFVRKSQWREWGLLSDLHVRIGLHAGPVFEAYDPVGEMNTYTGSHVSRAARIEPIVEEGQIYVSESFAALAAADGITDFVCDYVGEKSLAKKEGTSRIYLLRQRGQK